MRPHFLRDSTETSTDQLSDVLRLVEVNSVISGGFGVAGAWSTRFELSSPLKFVAMVAGRATLVANGVSGPIDIGTGDVVVLNRRSWATMSGGPDGLARQFALTEPNTFVRIDDGDDDVILGGHIDANRVGMDLLAAGLPPVLHVRASAADATHLRETLERIWEEATARRVGAEFAINQHAQLLVLTLLRAHLSQADELPVGWLRLLADERLRAAVSLMHTEPGRQWRLDELARVAMMSRTAFAERFRDVAGSPPLAYLSAWRMRLAQRALRDGDVRIGPLAVELGYTSESAFSTAFKREVGMSPLRYRNSSV
ncbi:AraC family transcriptional regulator [Mycolicibacterium baixiangningiae]|uniref:AraC family transcriptional regulator n=1 Tax=Mycolicibacterium baixiangningiae TaxID=2761578 RepID=UPI001865B2FE|nr:AraC family transcriptional regulator [Mycolicibacterium baixiangningiae]